MVHRQIVRFLGLVAVLSLLAACGNSGTGTPDGGAAASASGPVTSGAASAAASNAAASASGGASAASASAGGAAGSAAGSAAGGNGATIKIGSKNFTEQFILAEMYAQVLEANGFKVERNLGLASETVAHEALKNGEIDMYPEYTSTALLTILKLPQQTDRQQIYDTVKKEYESQFQITWLDASPFNNTQALAMTKQRADELGIKTYSDLSQKASELVLGGPPEFFEREDGVKGLQQAYGGFQFKDGKQLDPALRYQALLDGQIDVVVAFGTDGQIGGYDLALLEDDKSFYPPYQVAPVIRQDVLQANPQIAELLNPLSAKLDDRTMSNLNWAVDKPDGGQEPEAVAKQFLTENGFLK